MAKDNGTGTDITIFDDDGDANLPIDFEELNAGLGNLAQSIAAAGGIGGGMPFLTLQKTGHWTFGQERNAIDPNAEFIIDVRSLMHGYTAWSDGRVLHEHMQSAKTKLPPVTEMPPVGAEYVNTFSVEMHCLNGEDKGLKVLYKNNSWGGRGAFGDLGQHLAPRYARKTPYLFPVVHLRSKPWTSPKYGLIQSPKFIYLRWMARDGSVEGGGTEPPKPAPEAAAAAAAEAPAGVRRRRVG